MQHRAWLRSLVVLVVSALVCARGTMDAEALEENSPRGPKGAGSPQRLVLEREGLEVFLYPGGRMQAHDTRPLSSPAIVAMSAIHFYKRLISPRLGRQCRFRPTCSDFACQAIRNRGILTGIMLTADRLARDHGFIRAGDYPRDEKGICLDPVEPARAPRHETDGGGMGREGRAKR